MTTSMTTDDPVPRRALPHGNSNLPKDVPIIGLGCSSFSHFFWSDDELTQAGGAEQWTPETMVPSHHHVKEWIRTIHYAIVDCGITLLDTAPWYGHGTSEVVMGWALEELFAKNDSSSNSRSTGNTIQQQQQHQQNIPVLRANLTINTKVGRYEDDVTKQFDFTHDATMKSVERSLKRLKCHYIDVLQLHDPEFAPTLQVLLDETIPAMMECRQRGWCKALGMTGYPLEVQHQLLQATLHKYGTPVFDQALTYCHYNLHDSSLFDRAIDSHHKSYAAFLASNNIVLMAAAPLSMGLLTHHHAGPPAWHPASKALREACRVAASICETNEVNVSALAIVVALANPNIPCTLLGMKNVEQIKLAAEIAARFATVSALEEEEPDDILKEVLSEVEYKTWQVLKDKDNGPFSKVWADGTFRWDGSEDGVEFWKQVEGVQAVKWQRPPR